MNEKITLENFIKIKDELRQIYQESNQIYFSNPSEYEKYRTQYKEIQKRLLSYDLSDIPFEEWSGLPLFSDDDYIADFSRTHANLDFEIISELSNFSGKENFKNCNIKNLEFFDMAPRPENFDKSVIDANPSLFLSDLIPQKIKDLFYKNELSISSLSEMTREQLKELEEKNAVVRLPYKERTIVKELGFIKSLELFMTLSNVDFELLIDTFDYFTHIFNNEMIKKINVEFIEEILNAKPIEIKTVCYSCLKNVLMHDPQKNVVFSDLPMLFVKENPDFLLLDESITDELKQRYYTRQLTFKDLVDNYSLFENIAIDNFLDNDTDIYLFAEYLGFGNLQKVLKEHLDFVTYIIDSDQMPKLINQINRSLPFEERLYEAVKKYLLKYGLDDYIYDMETKEMNYILPKWISSFNFKFLEKIATVEDLKNIDNKTIVLHEEHRKLIERFGLKNILELERNIGYFSHKSDEFSRGLENLQGILDFFSKGEKVRADFDFKNGTLPYEEFEFEFIKLLNTMRKEGWFLYKPSYDWIAGDFREKYRQYFIRIDAPKEVSEAFYKPNYGFGIKAEYFYRCPDLIQYFKETNLCDCLDIQIRLKCSPHEYLDFVEFYTKRFGNEEFLKLMVKYGSFCYKLDLPIEDKLIESKKEVDLYFRKVVTDRITNSFLPFRDLKNVKEYYYEHSEMFVDFRQLESIPEFEKIRLENAFYERNISFLDIKMYPKLIDYLKSKNLFIAFGQRGSEKWMKSLQESRTGTYNKATDDFYELELINMYGNENFLKLCSEYGNYIAGVNITLHKKLSMDDGFYVNSENVHLTFDEIKLEIEEAIAEKCLSGELPYYPKDAPKFLIDSHPELFLSVDAPQDLKDSFYDMGTSLSFLLLEKHKEWLPYLEGKSIETALLRNNWTSRKSIIKYFKIFGDKAVTLGTKKAETVIYMIEHCKIDLMKSWYDLTGGRFVPDLVVMENFSLDLADKFFTSTSNWSSLMKIQEFSQYSNSREAMLKLAYTFGVFDQDLVGLKKLQTLLTDIPRIIDANHAEIIENICELVRIYDEPEKYCDSDNVEEYKKLADTLESEGVTVDRKEEIFGQIYKKNVDGTYTLTINPQGCPKTTHLVRKILNNYSSSLILSPNSVHQLFGTFELRYDKEFREFLLANMDEILNTPECANLISMIHAQFQEIKAINSNRKLTLNLAISFIQSNRFSNVNTGNERVAEVSAIAGYGQHEFNTLQKIYNYGRQRIFSSIPGIENTYGKYTYDFLRLDDPLAMVIGELTDCCQRLGHEGEVCMEHSMVDKDGRIFVIRDDEGNIIAQSWVWRNRDVVCFDNIEIPDKAFKRAEKIDPDLGRTEFSNIVFEIYQKAASELIEKDDKVYRQLLSEGKITEEQYEGLRLRKVTVGLGYNDIAASIKSHSTADKEKIARPLPFRELVSLDRSLYIADSNQQYVLAKDENRIDGSNTEHSEELRALSVYSEEYTLYDDSNFNEKSLLTLQKLELITKENVYNLNTSLGEDAKFGSFVTEIAKNYGLNLETCRIIMNSNFAIIFDLNGDVSRIGDLFYNTYIDNKDQQMNIEDTVVIQIRLALEIISKDKNIDISRLDEKQKEMYEKAMSLTDEIDIERGISIK